ncbi:nitroreductase/quinone reductase family protein [Ktedonobacter robiniae]|uniref:nitroreductase/quinone reductase family protein n=1 Tax=Ktedonobacter robiniae TaxID=2778365 RepID=UPI001F3F89A2|nr:nitroreductase/quinone reductase family protein [Ktedonobacter robiniae]
MVCQFGEYYDNDPAARGLQARRTRQLPYVPAYGAGCKSGQPRTVPIVTIERNGKRYLASPFGTVAWVRNLQAAGEATLTRGRRVERVNARELPLKEAALVLQEDIKGGNPFASYYQVNAESSFEEFERVASKHPVFLLQGAM